MEKRQNQGQDRGSARRAYVVQPGDTLVKISEKVYGDPKAFTDIYNANQDVILDVDNLVPGTELYIPPSAAEIHREHHENAPGDTAAGEANERRRQRQAGES